MSTLVATRISEDMLEEVEYVAKEENVDKSKVLRDLLSTAVKQRLLDLALEKYARRIVSLGRAAELAKVPLADFMLHAAERKIPINYSLASVEKDWRP